MCWWIFGLNLFYFFFPGGSKPCRSIEQSEVCKKNAEILLTVKAYNSRCITEWLAAELIETCRSEHMRRADARLPAISVCV